MPLISPSCELKLKSQETYKLTIGVVEEVVELVHGALMQGCPS